METRQPTYPLEPGERVYTSAPIQGSKRARSSSSVETALLHTGKYASVRRMPRIDMFTGTTMIHEEVLIVKDK